MEKQERSDPTFTVFVVLAFIFLGNRLLRPRPQTAG